MDIESPEHMVIKLSSVGTLAPDFTNEMLGMLAEADIKGRIAADTEERLEYVKYFREISAECKCLDHPFWFPSSFGRYAYLSGRNIAPGQDLYNDTWGTVILLAGLPGTGKDTFISHMYHNLPIVSLDVIRKKMNISPTEPQGVVAKAAIEQAKVYLRKQQPFVWNATNITPQTRKKLIDIFSGYKASVKAVFLETTWDEMLRRNQNRHDIVPESAIEGMLEKTIPPNLSETHEVEWVVV